MNVQVAASCIVPACLWPLRLCRVRFRRQVLQVDVDHRQGNLEAVRDGHTRDEAWRPSHRATTASELV